MTSIEQSKEAEFRVKFEFNSAFSLHAHFQ